jgi:uncharacterized protein (TIGR03435 family)
VKQLFVAMWLVAASAVAEQTAVTEPAFDVVSVKASPPYEPGVGRRVSARGGPGSGDPTTFTCENCSLASLISIAYGVPHYRLSAPDWMPASGYIFTAKVPVGVTRAQFAVMLQNALAERFKLAVHHEQREVQMYDLVVAKGGLKLKKAAEEPPPAEAPADAAKKAPMGPVKLAADGYPALSGGSTMAMMNGRARVRYTRQTMEWFAAILSGQVGQPVTDATKLTGNYEFELYWQSGGRTRTATANDPNAPLVAGDPDAGPTIFEALPSQLGLKLEQKKGPVDILVVEHAEKTPTEN